MKWHSTFVMRREYGTLLLLVLAAAPLYSDPRCAGCHSKEVEGYMKSGMARSLAPISSRSPPPDGSFEHGSSKTSFFVRSTSSRMTQGFTRRDESAQNTVTFVIGSGNHAFGYLIQIGDDLFQSPISYYTNRQIWDVAPGYEFDPHPDFSRPVTPECLTCHSGKPLPVADALNRYRAGIFAAYGISCERCHGDCEAHLKNPARGSVLNPAKLSGAARASICEQCHLTGEARIPNPGKSMLDFRPGQTLEDVYTTYVGAEASGQKIKVVSHAEQLALSRCARKSGGGDCAGPVMIRMTIRPNPLLTFANDA
jgi:Cytochrome c554 and c-prime